jgi:exonuclease VII small subunit
MIFGGGKLVYSIVENHNRTRLEMARIRMEQQTSTREGASDNQALREEVVRLRRELQELRDTSTQYDLSFDTALQRLERRVERVEGQQIQQLRN